MYIGRGYDYDSDSDDEFGGRYKGQKKGYKYNGPIIKEDKLVGYNYYVVDDSGKRIDIPYVIKPKRQRRKTTNPYTEHVRNYVADHPGVTWKDAMKRASASYKKIAKKPKGPPRVKMTELQKFRRNVEKSTGKKNRIPESEKSCETTISPEAYNMLKGMVKEKVITVDDFNKYVDFCNKGRYWAPPKALYGKRKAPVIESQVIEMIEDEVKDQVKDQVKKEIKKLTTEKTLVIDKKKKNFKII